MTTASPAHNKLERLEAICQELLGKTPPHHRQQPRASRVPHRGRRLPDCQAWERRHGHRAHGCRPLRPGHLGRHRNDGRRPPRRSGIGRRRPSPASRITRRPVKLVTVPQRRHTSGITTSSATRCSGSSSTSCGTHPARPTSAAPSTRPGKTATSRQRGHRRRRSSQEARPTMSRRTSSCRTTTSTSPPPIVRAKRARRYDPPLHPHPLARIRATGVSCPSSCAAASTRTCAPATSSACRRRVTSRTSSTAAKRCSMTSRSIIGRRLVHYRGHTTRVRRYPDLRRRRGLLEYAGSAEVAVLREAHPASARGADDRPRRPLRAQQEHHPRPPRLGATAGALSGVPRQGQLPAVPRALSQRARRLPDLHRRDLRAR